MFQFPRAPKADRNNEKLPHMLAAGALAPVATILPAHASEDAPKSAQAGIDLSGIHGFDFLVGGWRVHHRHISFRQQDVGGVRGHLQPRLLIRRRHDPGNELVHGRMRFIWSDTASASPRWQQAYSCEDGQDLETVWTMQFQRTDWYERRAADLPTAPGTFLDVPLCAPRHGVAGCTRVLIGRQLNGHLTALSGSLAKPAAAA